VRENPLDELWLLDARDHLQAPAAAHALLDLDPEYAYMDAPTLPSSLFMMAGRIRLHPYIEVAPFF